jgi:ribosomal protein S18 acetylase RimI-like enzyme
MQTLPKGTRVPNLPSFPPLVQEFRPGRREDIKSLIRLETSCFAEEKRDSRRCIAGSLNSPRQEVWVIEGEEEDLKGSLFLRRAQASLRIYSIAINPSFRCEGLGTRLLQFAIERARLLGLTRVFLESEAESMFLCEWYGRHGFSRERLLHNFYAPGCHAWRMIFQIEPDFVSA